MVRLIHTAVIRKAYGTPVLAEFSGWTPADAMISMWRYVRNTGQFGFRIDLESREHEPFAL